MTLRIILIGGPSGSGKSYLARRFGNPHVELDHFYKELQELEEDPKAPRTDFAQIDWDHPYTWNARAAVDALCHLGRSGRVKIPVYNISTSSVTGQKELVADSGPIIAEGLFSSEILGSLREAGMEVEAYLIRESSLRTACARFARDLVESRKPLGTLIRRGWALYRADADIVDSYLKAGFVPLRKAEIKRRLR